MRNHIKTSASLLRAMQMRDYARADTSESVRAVTKRHNHIYAALSRQARRPRVRRK